MVSEKRLYGVVSLTGIDFQKQGRGVFFFCSVTYTGFLKAIFLRIASQQAETKPAPVRQGIPRMFHRVSSKSFKGWYFLLANPNSQWPEG